MTAKPERGFESLCVVGLGYIGLPTAAIFASHGVQVLGVDIDQQTVDLINNGKAQNVEPELNLVVNTAVANGHLRAATVPAPADVFIIAVPTPFKDDHQPDLTCLQAAVENLAAAIKAGDLVVIESTVPVGTTEQVSTWLANLCPGLKFPHAGGDEADVFIAHSPERVLPGRIMVELAENDRVIGGISNRCAERAAEFYKIAVNGQSLLTTARTAELVKLSENAYRDVNIAFANELSRVCNRLGIDVWETVELANHHPRVNVLQPGPGVGGHCIAVDPWFIVSSAPDETDLIRAARKINNSKPGHVVKQIKDLAVGIELPKVACLGLAYKADIDDLRESPAVEIVRQLAATGMREILVVEPYVNSLPDSLADLDRTRLCDLDTALSLADIVVLLTDHRVFREFDRKVLTRKRMLDTRGAWR